MEARRRRSLDRAREATGRRSSSWPGPPQRCGDSTEVKGAQVSVTPNWIYAMSPESSCTANVQGKLGK